MPCSCKQNACRQLQAHGRLAVAKSSSTLLLSHLATHGYPLALRVVDRIAPIDVSALIRLDTRQLRKFVCQHLDGRPSDVGVRKVDCLESRRVHEESLNLIVIAKRCGNIQGLQRGREDAWGKAEYGLHLRRRPAPEHVI